MSRPYRDVVVNGRVVARDYFEITDNGLSFVGRALPYSKFGDVSAVNIPRRDCPLPRATARYRKRKP